MIPKGWHTEGGIVRVDPATAGGAAQSIEAKVDFAVKRDHSGTVMLRQLPDWYYCDLRHSPAGKMGMFPTGSNYNGMTVCPVMSPSQFITEIQNDMFLALTGREEYVNPYTKEVEVGSSQLGKYRWVTESGDVIFVDTEYLDPNEKSILNRTDWKRSEVRPRFPQ